MAPISIVNEIGPLSTRIRTRAPRHHPSFSLSLGPEGLSCAKGDLCLLYLCFCVLLVFVRVVVYLPLLCRLLPFEVEPALMYSIAILTCSPFPYVPPQVWRNYFLFQSVSGSLCLYCYLSISNLKMLAGALSRKFG